MGDTVEVEDDGKVEIKVNGKTTRVESVFVAAVLVTWGEHILSVFNPKWGEFTLPMTKQRKLVDTETAFTTLEPWKNAAARAASEALGVIFCPEGHDGAQCESILSLPFEQRLITARIAQSDRDGEIKAYQFHIYELPFVDNDRPQMVPGSVTTWLTSEQILDTNLRPISFTARSIVGALQGVAKAQGKRFPDSTIDWPQVHSRGKE